MPLSKLISRNRTPDPHDDDRRDLFEWRIEVFDAARDLILHAFRSSSIQQQVFNRFMRCTEKSVFLFDKSVNAYIVLLRNNA
jgi:hypothetical protein